MDVEDERHRKGNVLCAESVTVVLQESRRQSASWVQGGGGPKPDLAGAASLAVLVALVGDRGTEACLAASRPVSLVRACQWRFGMQDRGCRGVGTAVDRVLGSFWCVSSPGQAVARRHAGCARWAVGDRSRPYVGLSFPTLRRTTVACRDARGPGLGPRGAGVRSRHGAGRRPRRHRRQVVRLQRQRGWGGLRGLWLLLRRVCRL